jgi:arginase family enzyme
MERPAALMARRGLDWTLARIREVVAGADRVYLSVDLDVLGPAHAPGVGWHEPGGLTSRDLLELVVARASSVRGFALSELNPMTDSRAQSSILAANVIFQFAVAAVQNAGEVS